MYFRFQSFFPSWIVKQESRCSNLNLQSLFLTDKSNKRILRNRYGSVFHVPIIPIILDKPNRRILSGLASLRDQQRYHHFRQVDTEYTNKRTSLLLSAKPQHKEIIIPFCQDQQEDIIIPSWQAQARQEDILHGFPPWTRDEGCTPGRQRTLTVNFLFLHEC